MINDLRAISNNAKRTVTGPIVRTLAASAAQGICFALVVPFIQSLQSGNISHAAQWLSAMIVMLGLYSFLQYRAQIYSYDQGRALAAELYSRLEKTITRLPLGWFQMERVGALSKLMSNGIIDVMAVPAHLLRPVVGAFAVPAVTLLCMFAFSWQIGLVALCGAPFLWLAFRFAGNLAARSEELVDTASSDTNGRIVEFALAQPMLRAYDRHGLGRSLLQKAFKTQHAMSGSLLRKAVPGLILFSIVMQIFFTLILGQGFILARNGVLGMAEMVALMVLVTRFMEPMSAAADLGASIRIAGNTIRRIRTLLEEKPLPFAKQDNTGLDTSCSSDTQNSPEIQFNHVRFGYDQTDVIQDVSFTAPANGVTALVGPSGAGKSTLLHLAARFWDVKDGAISIGDCDVRDFPEEKLNGMFSFVFQKVYLFDTTLEENILIGKPDAGRTELDEVIRLTRIDEIVDRLPKGLQTRVGEGGTALSGGERQRVAIARAMLKPAPILLLDEATASLDASNQRAVQNALNAMRHKRTILIIAHRLETIRHADRIVVLDSHGQVESIGTHDEQIHQDGLYAEFWNRREQVRHWRLSK